MHYLSLVSYFIRIHYKYIDWNLEFGFISLEWSGVAMEDFMCCIFKHRTWCAVVA